MTGAQFKNIRLRYGATAQEICDYVESIYGVLRSDSWLYNMEADTQGIVPERWVTYLRSFVINGGVTAVPRDQKSGMQTWKDLYETYCGQPDSEVGAA